ncbi:HAD-IC family P-type ATPase [Desulfoluna spongiiphila]|uniref:Cu+-exporting ATPase n=1 Tax=Desulfoluna spongiiphila TaxID=419481 RepID=A0A1G5GMQ9_9BACT|nr:HAD-IC family P-type ATPase [Desulfoluna spongiiphila]SCY52833.1 Cu+-exporting ATPase [Desulfoluna spongiiphila]
MGDIEMRAPVDGVHGTGGAGGAKSLVAVDEGRGEASREPCPGAMAVERIPMPRGVRRVAWVFFSLAALAAVITFVGWFTATGDLAPALTHGAMVLMLACPCVLGVALPMAAYRGASVRGIGLVNRRALEHCDRLDTVVFCSGGGLTRGRPRVIHAIPMNGETESRLVRLADAVEAGSDHLLARAVALYAERVGNFRSRATGFQSHGGRGVEAEVNGRIVRVGKASWLTSLGVCFHHEGEVLDALEADGNTTLVVESGGKIFGFLAVSDGIVPGAESVVADLQRMGLTVLFMTGSPYASARGLALRLGMDGVVADLAPGEKGGAVAALRARGKRVGVVGGGAEDASALAEANLGIAVQNASQGPAEAADVVLGSGTLENVSRVVGMGRAFCRSLRQNLGLSLAFFLFLFPFAAGLCRGVSGLPVMLREPHPMAWAAVTAAVCLTVALNSFRRTKP